MPRSLPTLAIKSSAAAMVHPDYFIGTLTGWGDYWMVCADFADYVQAQKRAETWYNDQERWTKSSIINTATSGNFSTDRTMREYNRDTWSLPTAPALPSPNLKQI